MARQTYCNPLDLSYRYQHFRQGAFSCREGADPTLALFRGTYYLFVSMSAGFWHSQDLVNWEFHPDPALQAYDYAPDVREIDGYLYFSASRRQSPSPILRSADPLTQPFEEVAAPFPFWDPDLFLDDDGRLYFFWGCTNTDPIWGVELDRQTLEPIGERKALFAGDPERLGYERPGENGVVDKEGSAMYQMFVPYVDPVTKELNLPADAPLPDGMTPEAAKRLFHSIGQPFIEGAFMTKHNGRYYLQYACPGTEYNTYADGVYVAEAPLGPYTLQKENPFSAVPGGFITGAGHGSTIADKYGNYWHAATMRISVNHNFERRVGLFPAGFDKDGVLFCNQSFACYPRKVPQGRFDPWALEPEWMLLSYGKEAFASSTEEGSSPALAVDESCRTWWSAGSAQPGEWLAVDLGRIQDVRAIQVNAADQGLKLDIPEEKYGGERRERYIEVEPQISHYTLEASADGQTWETLEDVERECSNGYYEFPQGVWTRYVRVVGGQLPYGQALRISGLRVFGNSGGQRPAPAQAAARRVGPLDALVSWEPVENAQGCNVVYGESPDKLYHSWLVYGDCQVNLSTLIAGQSYTVRVDSFNENGVTPGVPFTLEAE